MSQVAGIPGSRVCELVDGFRRRLESSGTVCAESGEMEWLGGSLSIHTDYGPAGQDKETNQDFVLAWVPNQPARIQCAVAVADGVSSSFQAEIGARVGCWAGLAALTAEVDDFNHMCRRAMDAAGDAIGGLADEVSADADRYRPATEFPSTWNYTLREGLLLQTTLTLAWIEKECLNLVIVGDGGAMLVGFGGDRGTGNTGGKFLGGGNLETNRVHAVGPLNRRVSAFDYCGRVELDGPGVIALFTDGIARGFSCNESQLIGDLSSGSSCARELIERLVRERPREFEDNLTLALVRCD